ncbi:hypothetical protein JCM8547_001734 [Rhodosporidiobolus lusitaniae]
MLSFLLSGLPTSRPSSFSPTAAGEYCYTPSKPHQEPSFVSWFGQSLNFGEEEKQVLPADEREVPSSTAASTISSVLPSLRSSVSSSSLASSAASSLFDTQSTSSTFSPTSTPASSPPPSPSRRSSRFPSSHKKRLASVLTATSPEPIQPTFSSSSSARRTTSKRSPPIERYPTFIPLSPLPQDDLYLLLERHVVPNLLALR